MSGSSHNSTGALSDAVVQAIGEGDIRPVYLVSGDLVVAEPQALRIAERLAEAAGCEVDVHRRPADLNRVFTDLQTFSLFASAKIVLVIDAAILADARSAADLVDEAAEGLPVSGADVELDGRGREAASRLMQALRVFGIDPESGSASSCLGELPEWAFQGGAILRKKKPRGRSKKQAGELKNDLAVLLEAGLRSGLLGIAEGDLAELGKMAEGGLPDGHALVLAERVAAEDHPVVQTLRKQHALVQVAQVTAGKRGFDGLSDVVAELERTTGVGITRDALDELARRTLKQSGGWRDKGIDAESTGRFAGEYRKLANLAQAQGDGELTLIRRQLVEETVKDRGDEDVWKILDAVAEGRGDEALARYHRLMESSGDAMGARLSFFGLLAGFCRQLTAVAGMARSGKVPPGVRNYNQFKNRWAPVLQGETPDGAPNPLKGLHPFRLHRSYLAASQMDRGELGKLPWRVLETELQIKGEVTNADAAVAALLGRLVASRL
ncbi:MAG: hypothetical protein MPN21_01995 [Thermoanaerobaculia bacterium]|nr:hypothetical protein [Thermoanaerobaculia bacterium]